MLSIHVVATTRRGPTRQSVSHVIFRIVFLFFGFCFRLPKFTRYEQKRSVKIKSTADRPPILIERCGLDFFSQSGFYRETRPNGSKHTSIRYRHVRHEFVRFTKTKFQYSSTFKISNFLWFSFSIFFVIECSIRIQIFIIQSPKII